MVALFVSTFSISSIIWEKLEKDGNKQENF